MEISEEALVPAAPDRTWQLVTEPRFFQQWYAFGGAEIELAPGGAMVLRWDEHGGFPARVEAVEPGRRFAFRWLPEPGDLVEITLSPQAGATSVRITESGVLEDAATSAMAWRNALSLLVELGRGD
ncbi:SRPBCC domain-containing protein [Streptomyces formicae]|uniref:SRPBCC domain-containing protein n=1 Tax=Streptomyces formicae TaxID=1616117 RepID=A0ABY3WLJ7_9ACTN|nr:SRPBCC domain-containing protein [Streptomyces formicae]UNM10718.1 SRPBCC domain-containing protein [Streptomyces formicae]